MGKIRVLIMTTSIASSSLKNSTIPSNVDLIIHMAMPASLEEYEQRTLKTKNKNGEVYMGPIINMLSPNETNKILEQFSKKYNVTIDRTYNSAPKL